MRSSGFLESDEPEEAGSPAHWEPNRLGFPLTFAGLVLIFLGFAAFLWGQTIPGLGKYEWRRVAGVAIGLASALFVLGLQVALPSRYWARWMAGAGCALTVAGTAAFAWWYPYHWNVPGSDMSVYGLVPFATGILLLGSAAFTGALDAYIDLRTGRPVGTRARAANEGLSEEEIQNDIEAATRRSRLTWGGVYDQDGPTVRLKEGLGDDVQVLTGAIGRKYTLDGAPTGGAVTLLRAFRGGAVTAQEDEDASPVEALKALRQERAADPAAMAPGAATLMDRIVRNMRAWLSPYGGAPPQAHRPAASPVPADAFDLLGENLALAFDPVDAEDAGAGAPPDAAYAALGDDLDVSFERVPDDAPPERP